MYMSGEVIYDKTEVFNSKSSHVVSKLTSQLGDPGSAIFLSASSNIRRVTEVVTQPSPCAWL